MESTLLSYTHNFTIEDEVDFFEEVYSEPILKWIIVGFYFLGFFAIVGLGIVTWFERSGEAGPYRTLINRLTSNNIEMVSSHSKIQIDWLVCSFFAIL